MTVIKILRTTGRTPIKSRMMVRKPSFPERIPIRVRTQSIKARVRARTIRVRVGSRRRRIPRAGKSPTTSGIQVLSQFVKMMIYKEAKESHEMWKKAPPSPKKAKKRTRMVNSRGAEGKQGSEK